MPLFLLALSLPVAVGSVSLSQHLLSQTYALQKSLVALDNAAILLGRSAREVYTFLEHTNKTGRNADAKHHSTHACAQVPATRAACQPIDSAAHLAQRAWLTRRYATAQALWVDGAGKASSAAARLGVAAQVERSVPLRLVPKRCGVCFEPVGWTWRAPVETVRVQFGERELRSAIEGKWNPLQKRWTYEIQEVEGG